VNDDRPQAFMIRICWHTQTNSWLICAETLRTSTVYC